MDELRMIDFARAARMAAASITGNGDGIRQVIAEARDEDDPEASMGGLLAALGAGYASVTAQVFGEDQAEAVLLAIAAGAVERDQR